MVSEETKSCWGFLGSRNSDWLLHVPVLFFLSSVVDNCDWSHKLLWHGKQGITGDRRSGGGTTAEVGGSCEDPLQLSLPHRCLLLGSQGDVFKDLVGSAYFVAPEVLRRSYGAEADIWSAGVILYILLSGVPPFWGQNEQCIFDAVLRGNPDFASDPWPSISSSVKDLVKKMLQSDPKERLSATEVLNHPWIREDGDASDKPIDIVVLSRMKQLRAMNKLKKVALKVIAENLSEEEIVGLKEM